MDVRYELVQGVDVGAVVGWVGDPEWLFIEDYNPSNYAREDKKMLEAMGRLHVSYPPGDHAVYVDNAGANTLIPAAVLRIFKVDRFPVSTHHNDLVSAGKIALLGMLKSKDTGLRELLSTVVRDELNGLPWAVMQHA